VEADRCPWHDLGIVSFAHTALEGFAVVFTIPIPKWRWLCGVRVGGDRLDGRTGQLLWVRGGPGSFWCALGCATSITGARFDWVQLRLPFSRQIKLDVYVGVGAEVKRRGFVLGRVEGGLAAGGIGRVGIAAAAKVLFEVV